MACEDMIAALPYHLSDRYLLTRTYLYIIKRLHRDTIRRFTSKLNGRLLDVGCGTSPYKPLFAHTTYIGLDLAPERHPDAIANAQNLPVRSTSMDSVLCTEILEHVPDPDQVMREIWRVLVPGGVVLITTPMSWNLHYEPFDFRRYTCYGLQQLLNRHGFEIIEIQRIGGLFSLIGSRLVDGVATELWRRWRWMPRKLRHGLILCYSIPVSLVFMLLATMADDFETSDAIGWAVLAVKPFGEDN